MFTFFVFGPKFCQVKKISQYIIRLKKWLPPTQSIQNSEKRKLLQNDVDLVKFDQVGYYYLWKFHEKKNRTKFHLKKKKQDMMSDECRHRQKKTCQWSTKLNLNIRKTKEM